MPSKARTQYIQADPSPSDVELRWPERDIADALDCTIDYTNFLADAGDTLNGIPAVASQPSDLVLTPATQQAAPGTAATWIVSGGTLTNPITDYAIVVTATTVGGLTITRTVYQRTGTLSINTSYTGALSVVKGDTGTGIATVTGDDVNLALKFALTNGNTQSVSLAGLVPGLDAAVSTELGSLTANLASTLQTVSTLETGIATLTGNQLADEATAAALGNSISTFETSTGTSLAALTAGLANAIRANVPFTIVGTWNAASNTPSLSNGGAGLSPETALVVSTPGSTALDGNNVWGQNDFILCIGEGAGQAFIRIPGNSISATSTIVLNGVSTITEDLGTPGGVSIIDPARFRYVLLDHNGVQSANATITNITATAMLSAPMLLCIGADGSTFFSTDPTAKALHMPGGATIVAGDGIFGWGSADRFRTFKIDTTQGTFSGTPDPASSWLGVSSTSHFSPQDIAQHIAATQAYSDAIRNTPINGIHVPGAAAWTLVGGAGASRYLGETGFPLLNLAAVYDIKTFGQSVRGIATTGQQVNAQSAPGTFVCVGVPGMYPAVATAQTLSGSTGTLVTPAGGTLSGLTGVTVSGTAHGTFTWAGGAAIPPGFLAVGTGLQLSGATSLPALNQVETSAQTLTVQSASGTTLVTVEPPPATGIDAGPITITGVNVNVAGEGPDLQMAGGMRQRQLQRLGVPTNVSYLPNRMWVQNFAISGAKVAQVQPGGLYWSLVITGIPQAQAQFGGGTSECAVWMLDFGGNDGGSTTNADFTSGYLANIDGLNSQVFAGPASLFKQDYPSLILGIITDGAQLKDTNPAGEMLPISSAQLAIGGASPHMGAPSPWVAPTPRRRARNNFVLAARHWGPSHGEHSTSNSYCNIGDLLDFIDDWVKYLRRGWVAAHIVAVSVKQTEWVVDVHFNASIGGIWPFFQAEQETFYSDWGLSPQDAQGYLTIDLTTLRWAGPNLVMFSCIRASSVAQGAVLWYSEQGAYFGNGNGNHHGGFGNLAGLIQTQARGTYRSTPGSGQMIFEDKPNAVTNATPLANGAPYPLLEFVAPDRIVAVQG